MQNSTTAAVQKARFNMDFEYIVIIAIIIIAIYNARKKKPGTSKKQAVRKQKRLSAGRVQPNKSLPMPDIKYFRGLWCLDGNIMMIQSYEVPRLFLYIDERPLNTGTYSCSCIDTLQEAAPFISCETKVTMENKPSYSTISPECRGGYLDWLRRGRNVPNAHIGYAIMFLGGLERRIVTGLATNDLSPDERSAIVNEICRLLSIYGWHDQFRFYANNLMALERILFSNDTDVSLPNYFESTSNTYLNFLTYTLTKYAA